MIFHPWRYFITSCWQEKGRVLANGWTRPSSMTIYFSVIHKERHPKSYHCDIKIHYDTRNIIFSVVFVQIKHGDLVAIRAKGSYLFSTWQPNLSMALVSEGLFLCTTKSSLLLKTCNEMHKVIKWLRSIATLGLEPAGPPWGQQVPTRRQIPNFLASKKSLIP